MNSHGFTIETRVENEVCSTGFKVEHPCLEWIEIFLSKKGGKRKLGPLLFLDILS